MVWDSLFPTLHNQLSVLPFEMIIKKEGKEKNIMNEVKLLLRCMNWKLLGTQS